MPLSELDTIIKSYQELQRLHTLNMELLEQLNIACGYFVDNDIPLPNYATMYSLFNKSKALLAEIQSNEPKFLQYSKLSRRKVTDFDNRHEGNRTLHIFF